MPTIALTCNHCGAPLEIPNEMRFLTCSHCGSRLEVKHSGSVVYTAVLERIEKQAEQIVDGVETIQMQNELERLDREWEMERRQFVIVSKNGRESLPDPYDVLRGMLTVGVGLVLSIATAFAGAGIFVIVGLIAIFVGVCDLISSKQHATYYRQRWEIYGRKRAELVSRIEQRV